MEKIARGRDELVVADAAPGEKTADVLRNRIGRNYLIFTPLMMSAELHAGLLRRSRQLFPCQFSRRLDRLILPAASPSDAPYQETSDDDIYRRRNTAIPVYSGI